QDAEARLTLLRERAGVSSKSKRKEEQERERELLKQATDPDARREAIAGQSSLTATGGGKHINLFEELEQGSITAALTKSRELDKLAKGKGRESAETEKGFPLAPSAKDLKPWYSEKVRDPEKNEDDGRRTRDLSHKSRSDPLFAIQRELETRFPSTSSHSSSAYHQNTARRREWGASAPYDRSKEQSVAIRAGATGTDPARSAREVRESSERARAFALIERKKRELVGSATPSTVRGGAGDDTFRYGDQFNSRAVAEAHRRREGPDVQQRGWEGEYVRNGDWTRRAEGWKGSRDADKRRQ
ncbi:hypothetical protein M0805_008394, partial [Coniferiporia weirii]